MKDIKKIKRRKKSILDSLQSIEGHLFDFPEWGYNVRKRFPGLSDKELEKIYEYRRIQYLKNKKWIKIKKQEGKMLCELTDEGKSEMHRRAFTENRPKLPRKTKCLVVYDFPENARRGRDSFRFFLRSCDFKMLQKSVWITDRDVVEAVQKFIRKTGISKWVCVFVGDRKK